MVPKNTVCLGFNREVERAFVAIMTMRKIDQAAINAAGRG